MFKKRPRRARKPKMPESYVRPLREALEERKTKQARVYDPAKRLERLTAQRNRTLKLKEELQAEVDEQRASLAAAEGRLAKAVHACSRHTCTSS